MKEVNISGFGGQGVVLGSSIVAHIALTMGKNVTLVPTHGAEQRGGASSSVIKFGDPDEEICNPSVEETDVLIAMNGQALQRFLRYVKPGGVVLNNSNISEIDVTKYPDCKVHNIPANDLSASVNNRLGANFVMIGAATKLAGLFPKEEALEGITDYFRKIGRGRFIEMNCAAFMKGYEAVS